MSCIPPFLNTMILAIDAYEANAQNRVGVGRFAAELLRHIYKEIESKKTSIDGVRVYMPQPAQPHMPKATNTWEYRVRSPKTFWTFWALPLALRNDTPRADVVFSPTHYVPRFTPVPKVMAIMDVSYLEYPELFRRQDVTKLTRGTAYSVAHAAHIITISEFSKNAIIKAYKVDSGKVSVIYPAIPESIVKSHMAKGAKSKSLPKRYILSVGTLQPRKNFSRLIEAFSRLPDKDVHLLIVGKRGWLFEDILAAPKKYNVSDRVQFLDYVPDSELPALYEHAQVFALPSLYEGFGLPVLEAMTHATPVVVSKVSSLPEIAGEAGIYVNPEDIGSIVYGLSQALREKGTKAEADRVALGKRLAKRFSWSASAQKVLRILETVGKKGSV